MSLPPPRLAIIGGPTGAGKSELALKIARAINGQIINADSLALYRGFDLGTAKPGPEELRQVPHHLIDVLDPDQSFDAAAYLRRARPIVEELGRQGRPALAVGGAGFYLRSLTRGLFEGPGRDPEFRARLATEVQAGADLHARLTALDPETAARLAPADRPRLERALEVLHLSGRSISQWQREHALAEKPFETLSLIIDRRPEEMRERLERRTRAMFEAGLAAEVEALLAAGWPPTLKPFGAIGYKEVLQFLQGRLSLDEALGKTLIATRRYAKRQRTWFRGQMPEGLWFHPDQYEEILSRLRGFFRLG
ncbi:MAG: tRNA (adenosine(37)-N6)-dimethylallyltransferase MiaA [Candidatus Adiutrix sp.]|jgi:tRNA dimethylallyltransferase|nr:tRNA (adenosine(37)-N6)-dimethylallyltransferase MiaA [Candidatus Adiutrix sp.]